MESWKYIIHAIMLAAAAWGGAQYEKSKFNEHELTRIHSEQRIVQEINKRESVIAQGLYEKIDNLSKTPVTNTKSTIIKEPVYIVQCLDDKGIQYLKEIKEQGIKVRKNE